MGGEAGHGHRTPGVIAGLAEEGLDNLLLDIPHHPALAQSPGAGASADGSSASNRKFKGFRKAASPNYQSN